MKLTGDQALEKAKKAGQSVESTSKRPADDDAKKAHSHYNLGNELQELGKLAEAEESYRSAIVLRPNVAQVHNNLGNTLKEMGRLEEAEESFKKAIELKPDLFIAYNNYGTVLDKLNKFAESEASFRKAIALNPTYSAPYSNLGNVLIKIGRLKEAKECYRSAIKLDSDNAEFHGSLGIILQGLSEFREAELSFKRAIKSNPAAFKFHLSFGNMLLELNRLEEAEASYRQTLLLKPGLPGVHYNLAITLQELGRLEEAVASYREAITVSPDFTEAHYNLGNVFRRLGKLEEAEKSYNRALILKPDFEEAYNNLGGALTELGRIEEAQRNLQKAIELKPDFSDAHCNLGVLFYIVKKYNQALHHFDSSNSERSQAYKLKCLYYLNEETLFYRQLDEIITGDIVNPTIGSFTSRSEIKYGIKKRNVFADDPLKYVLKTNLLKKYEFKKIFVDPIKNLLETEGISLKNQKHLTNGTQTSGDVFSMDNEFMAEIEKIIYSEIEQYRTRFKKDKEGFLVKWPIDYHLHGWLISMNNGGKLSPHIHDTGWISGTIYINVPPKTVPSDGNLVVSIGEKLDETENRKNKEEIIDVFTGDLVIFPSSLTHYTIPFQSDERRIVLAFDVVPGK